VEGKGGASVFVVLALLALAIFFYVRAVAPPASSPAPTTADPRAPLPGTPATVALPPVAPAGEGRPAGSSLDPKLVDGLSSVIGTGKAAAEEQPAAAPTATATASGAEAEAPAEPTPQVAAETGAPAEPAPTGPAAAGTSTDELKPLPERQLDAITELFAPELQR
jgi:hypothetical protein